MLRSWEIKMSSSAVRSLIPGPRSLPWRSTVRIATVEVPLQWNEQAVRSTSHLTELGLPRHNYVSPGTPQFIRMQIGLSVGQRDADRELSGTTKLPRSRREWTESRGRV